MRVQFSRAGMSGGLAFATLIAAAGLAAAAPDAKKTADDLVAAITASGDSQASYGQATVSGNNVAIANLKVTSKTNSSVQIPSMVIRNPLPRPEGGFTAEQMTFDGAKMTGEGSTVALTKGSIDAAVVPSPGEIKAKTRITPFSKMSLGGLNVSGGELKQPVAISTIDVALGNVVDGTPREMKFTLAGLNLPGALFDDDAQTKAMLKTLGYAGFVVNVAVDGGYDPPSDTLSMRTVEFDIKDVGKLTVNAVLSGIPLHKLQSSEGAKELVATAKINNATFRFQNAGVVERVLDMQSKSMGVSRQDFVTQMTGALPLMLNIIGNPGFQTKLASAVTAFLKDPKSVAVTSKPTAPLPLTQIVGAATTAWQTLPDILAVDIIANRN